MGISCGFNRSDLHCDIPLQTAAKEEGQGREKKRKRTETGGYSQQYNISIPSKDGMDLPIIPMSMFSIIFIKQFIKNSEVKSLFIGMFL